MNGYRPHGLQERQLAGQAEGGAETAPLPFGQSLQEAELAIERARQAEAEGHLTRLGASNISQHIVRAEQELEQIGQDLQRTAGQLQTQLDAQLRQIDALQQKVGSAMAQFRSVDQMVKQRFGQTTVH